MAIEPPRSGPDDLTRPLVLVVEDESALNQLLQYNLERAGYRVRVAEDGDEALLAATEEPPDLVVLDWMLPGLSGIEVCRLLRRRSTTQRTPILMLTARGEDTDKVRGLETGADDYVTKPFSPAELLARIKALLRRAKPALAADSLTYADITLDKIQHRVMRDGEPVHLGPTEFRLLRYFMERPGRVLSREQLLDAVWGSNIHVEIRTVDAHIRRLRKALNMDGKADLIRTVRSAGYALDTAKG